MKSKTPKKSSFIVINKSIDNMVMDEAHVIAMGTTEILKKRVIDKHYNRTSFSFDFLKRAEMYFRSIHGDLFDESKLRCMISDRKAPIIFIYNARDTNQVFAIAPRVQGVDD